MFCCKFVVGHLVVQGLSGFLAAKAVSNWVSVVLSLSLMSVCSSSEFEDSMEDTLELSFSFF